jgi:hypothetical protein
VSDPEPVGSVTMTPADPVADKPALVPPVAASRPKSRKAKAKSAAPKAKAKAAAPKAKAKPRRQARTMPPNGATGYGVVPNGFFGAPMSRQAAQPKLLWPGN